MDRRLALLAEIDAEMRDTAAWTGRDRLSSRVRTALAKVRREAFVPPGAAHAAYANAPLPIGCGQTISQPFIVALMTELLDLEPGQRVLEIGTGSGYQAAVLAELTDDVCSIETVPELAERAGQTLERAGYGRVALRTGDGGLGWPERAPFDAIIVTAAASEVPPALLEQLAPGGRMVIPIGPPGGEQQLVLLRKGKEGAVDSEPTLPVAFVPFVRTSTA